MSTVTGAAATKYARVRLYRWIGRDVEEIQDEPVGVITMQYSPIWIKVGWKWFTWATPFNKVDFFVLDKISQAEYETDLALGLFKKLHTSSRPVREWFNQNESSILYWNGFVTLTTSILFASMLPIALKSTVVMYTICIAIGISMALYSAGKYIAYRSRHRVRIDYS